MLKAPCPFRVGTSAGTACAAQAPVLSELKADGATVLATTTLVDSITALVSPALARALRSSPAISQVVPDIALGSSPPAPATPAESPDSENPSRSWCHITWRLQACSAAHVHIPNWTPKLSR